MYFIVNSNCPKENIVNIIKEMAVVKCLSMAGKINTIRALNTHCVNTGTDMALPRIRFGKISGM